MENKNSQRMPTLFISHGGGPWPFFESHPPGIWKKMESWLRGIGHTLPRTPKSILIISGHWEEDLVTLNTNPNPGMLYDYSGFPANTYELKYPAPGDPTLAKEAQSLLESAGFKISTNSTRGYDHGVFVPLMLMFPEAKIPILQISILSDYSPEKHLRMGKALESLRDQDVLIVASGLTYHNMRGFSPRFTEISRQFDEWLTSAVCSFIGSERNSKLLHWTEGEAARLAHPAEDHLIPIMVAVGAAEKDTGKKIFSDLIMNVHMSAYQFG